MSQTLNIPINDKTRRKLGALAILTGKKFDSMEQEIAELLDQVLSDKLDAALANLDGREPASPRLNVNQVPQFLGTTESPPRKSFADIEQESQPTIEDPVTDLAGHALSHDEDTGAPSLEEQIEQDLRAQPARPQAPARTALPAQAQDEDFLPPEIEVPDVGANTEAFLDTVLEAEQPPPRRAAKQINSYGRGTGAARSFNPQKRQARVSDYTGSDEGDIL